MPTQIFILDAYYGDSHRVWAEGLLALSSEQVFFKLFTLPPRHWKWQMEYGAIELSEQVNKASNPPDIILATDMVNLALLKSLVKHKCQYWLYMHENQITYPISPDDPDKGTVRNQHYGFINFTSTLVANRVIFNSQYHRDNFLAELPSFLKQFPKNQLIGKLPEIAQKSEVIPLAFDFEKYKSAESKKQSIIPKIVWNHRWEFDKKPQAFLSTMISLQQKGSDFELILLGQGIEQAKKKFAAALLELSPKIIHCGYAPSIEEYVKWLHSADIVVSTANHEFFGVSVVEAMICGCYPILPNRLAYPELIPERHHDKHLYEEPIVDTLIDLLSTQDWKTPIDNIQTHLKEKLRPQHILSWYTKKEIPDLESL